MKLQDLEYFIFLAESHSFTKTAEHFFVSQPSISIALKRLEEEYNTSLLHRDRSAKSVNLTTTGEILYNSAINILDILERTKKSIQSAETSVVYLGTLPTIGRHFLPQLLPSLSQFADSLKLIEEESSDTMHSLVKDQKVPVAIIGSDQPAFNETTLTQIPIAHRHLSIGVAQTHPLAKHSKLTSSMLKDISLVSLAKGYTHQRIFKQWLEKHRIILSNIHYANEVQTLHSMIASGMYAGVTSSFLSKDHKDIIEIPLEDAPVFYVSLLINNEMEQMSAQKEFNHALVSAVQRTFPSQ